MRPNNDILPYRYVGAGQATAFPYQPIGGGCCSNIWGAILTSYRSVNYEHDFESAILRWQNCIETFLTSLEQETINSIIITITTINTTVHCRTDMQIQMSSSTW